MTDEELYAGREQTLVKHFILQHYLERFAHIVGSYWSTLTYVDCFSGPWNARSDKFEDSSFAIALAEMIRAKQTLQAQRGKILGLRCFFLERDREAYAKLKQFADEVSDATIETKNATLEDSVSDIVEFVRSGGPGSFPFVFIDPTGWTGFEMDKIAPLLRLNPGEVLVNLMTGHIRRFLESTDTQTSLRLLFGSDAFRERVSGLSQQDRDDAFVEEYVRVAREVGGFAYACNAIVLRPEFDRTHFNLVYLTRSAKGVEVFKEAEKRAMALQEATRAKAKQRRRVERTGQGELFPYDSVGRSTYYDSLRERYLTRAKESVFSAIHSRSKLPYDDAWYLALSHPLIWESDLKEWIETWVADRVISISGMLSGQRVPRRGERNIIEWK